MGVRLLIFSAAFRFILRLILHPEVAGFDFRVLIQIFGRGRMHNLTPAQEENRRAILPAQSFGQETPGGDPGRHQIRGFHAEIVKDQGEETRTRFSG